MALKFKQQAAAPRPRLTLLRPGESQTPEPSEHLWAAIYLPQLALDVLLPASATQQAALCSIEAKNGCRVLLANSAATEQGIQADMALSAARALLPEVLVLARDAVKEVEAAETLAQQLYGFSAWIHIAEPNMLLLELKASLKLFGGLDSLLEQLRQLLFQPDLISGHTIHHLIAVAPTPSAAMLLARAGDETPLLYTSHTAGRLANVPLSLIEAINPKWWHRLQKLGLQHYGELLRLPQAGLRKRFGADFSAHMQMLQGQLAERPAAWKPPSRYQQQQDLVDEFQHSGELLPALLEMLDELCSWLQQRAARIQRFSVKLHGHKQCLSAFDVAFLRPNNRRPAMQKLLELRLEREVLAAPVVAITLAAEQLIYPRQLSVGQQNLWLDEQESDESWWDSLETIQARLGAPAVQGLQCADEHRPERAWQTVLPGEVLALASDAGDLKAGQRPMLERPLWLYEKPRRLSTREQGELRLQSRPERIASGWWDQDPIYRDYFVAQLDKQKLWVFRELVSQQPVWFCHGVFH